MKATGSTSHFCVMARAGTLYSIHMHIDFELFTAFSYTGSPKTDQGGDNQARHVVLTLESGISLPEALFPVKKSMRMEHKHVELKG